MSKQLVYVFLGLCLAFQVALAATGSLQNEDFAGDEYIEEGLEGGNQPEGEDEVEFSELALIPADDEEISNLGEASLFADYCIKSRDYVSKFLKDEANGAVARAFVILFKSAEDVMQDMVSIQRLAVDSLGNQIQNPSSPIQERTPASEAERIILDEQKKVQEQNQAPKSLLGAFLATIRATGSAIISALMGTLSAQKENINWISLFGALSTGCDKILELEAELKTRHASVKKTIVEQDPAYEPITFSKTPCVTTKRISQLQGMCGVVKYSLTPLLTVLQTQGMMGNLDAQGELMSKIPPELLE